MSVINVNKEIYENEIIKSEKTVLLDFWATWCGPCRMMAPVVDEIADENESYLVGKVNVDDEPELAQAFGIMSIPTLVAMREGKEIGRLIGVRGKSEVLAMLG